MIIYALEYIESAALGNQRLAAIKACDSRELREIFNYTLSGSITFGVKKLPEPSVDVFDRFSDDSMWYRHLIKLLEALKSRELTGAMAQQNIAHFLGRCDGSQLKWAQRILKQDLRLSVGAKDVNKALGEMVVRVFSIPLAKPFKELKSLKGKWYLQLKMDGGRCVSEIDGGGKVRLMSRSGKEWGSSLDQIKHAVQRVADDYSLKDCVLDGEVVIFKNGRMNFQAMQRMFFAQDGRKPDGDMVCMLFDYASTEEYFNPKMEYQDRLNSMNRKFDSMKLNESVEIIESELLIDPDQKYLDGKAVEFVKMWGCDGGIIRRADKVVTNRKSSDITKIKPFEDGEAKIIGKVEGTGWLEGSLGALVCVLPSGVQFEIGTGEGLTKYYRDELWNDPDLTTKLATLKWLRLSEDGVPVNPTLRGVRHPNDI
jgi:ATP-dependent DNA ligase